MRLTRIVMALAVVSCNMAAHAFPITYTFSGVFSGKLGAIVFTNDAGTLTLTGDTAGVVSLGSGFYTNTNGVGTVALDGVGKATFLSTTFGAESEYGAVALYDIPTGFGVGVALPSVGSYDLLTTLPPLTGQFLAVSNPGTLGESTSLGDLLITDAVGPVSFGATVTPEPASLLLLGTGVLGAAGAIRRRRFF